MEPVRVKLYGLFSITRRGYLLQLVVAVALLLVLLAVWVFVAQDQQTLAQAERRVNRPPVVAAVLTVLHWLPWIECALALLLLIEAFVVLRCFARKEAAQHSDSGSG